MSLEEPMWVNEVKSSTYDMNNLPRSIEKDIRDYLAIEYAPDFEATLNYIGEFMLWGKPIKCWDFGSEEVFATVQPYGDAYIISVTDKEVTNIKDI